MEIIVFQQSGSAERKTAGIKKYGKDISIKKIFSIDEALPEVLDNPEEYLSEDFSGDLVLNFLKHPDLSSCLVELCEKKSIPVVTTGKPGKGYTPFTCCGLGRAEKLGKYGDQFGFPEYHVDLEDGRISHIEVMRGAPCGATWAAMLKIVGLPAEEALVKLPLQVQQNCFANPSAFDPISGKSPVHYAGYVHLAALKKAIETAPCRKKDKQRE
jgi:thymidylate synthase